MKLYEQQIEYHTEQMLQSMIDLSDMKSSQIKHRRGHLDEYMTVFGFGRRSGHTTAITNWIKNNTDSHSSDHLIVLVTLRGCRYSEDMLGLSAHSIRSRNIMVFSTPGDSNGDKLRGLRFNKITMIGDSVHLSDFRKAHHEVMYLLSPCVQSRIRATCVNPLI